MKRVHEGRSKEARVMENVPNGEPERTMNARTLYGTYVASVSGIYLIRQAMQKFAANSEPWDRTRWKIPDPWTL